jgi:hypothetical protein
VTKSEFKHPSLLGPEWPWNLVSECLLPLKARLATLPTGISLVPPPPARLTRRARRLDGWGCRMAEDFSTRGEPTRAVPVQSPPRGAQCRRQLRARQTSGLRGEADPGLRALELRSWEQCVRVGSQVSDAMRGHVSATCLPQNLAAVPSRGIAQDD